MVFYFKMKTKLHSHLITLFFFLKLVPNIHWIVIEDAKSNTILVQNLLSNCGVVYTLLNEFTPPDQKLSATDKHWSKPRGVHQRNAGLHWVRDAFRNLPANQIEGVIYFAGK